MLRLIVGNRVRRAPRLSGRSREMRCREFGISSIVVELYCLRGA